MNESSESGSFLLLLATSSPSLNSTKWLLAEELSGPAISAFVCLEFLLGLPSNLFIIVHTLCYGKKYMNKSSTLLFFILAVTDLLTLLLYMPFWIVASAAGEWIFGSTDFVRDVLCQINGFVILFLITSTVYTLAVISVDRFLMIVKSQIHKKYMTWKTSLIIMIVLWMIDVLLSAAPYYGGSGFGSYGWSSRTGSCFAIFEGHRLYVLLQAIHAVTLISIIAITSIWTFLFTRGFLRKNLKRHRETLSTADFVEQKHIYSTQVLNLFGIFGSLLLFNFISWVPFLLISAVGIGIGFASIPLQVFATSFVIFHFGNVSNPIIQTMFRRDLINSLKKVTVMCKKGCKVSCNMRKNTNSLYKDHPAMPKDVNLADVSRVRTTSMPPKNEAIGDSSCLSNEHSIRTEETLDQDDISVQDNFELTGEHNVQQDSVNSIDTCTGV